MSDDFKCPECGNSYDTKRGLHIHIGQKHPDEKEEILEKTGKDSEAKTDKEKKSDESEGKENVFSFGALSTPVKVGLVALMVIVLGALLVYGTETDLTFGEETDADAVDRAVDFISRDVEAMGAEVELLDSTNTGSGVYEFKLQISMEGFPADNFTGYVTDDGEILFQEGRRLDLDEDATVEEIGEEGADVLKDLFIESIEADILQMEQMGDMEEEIEMMEDQIETMEIEFSEEVGTFAGLHHLELFFSVEFEGERHEQVQEAYATKDGQYFLLGPMNITEQEMMTEEMEVAEQEETETPTGDMLAVEEPGELVDCLDEEGVTIYGSEWCPYCTELAEAFGGYDTVDPIWVECTEEEQRCEEEMQGQGVPEIQINGELYEGPRDPESIAQEVGC